MKIPTTKHWALLVFAAAALASHVASAQNVYYYTVVRHDYFVQATTNRASTVNAVRHYLDATVQSYTGGDYVDSGTVKVPTGQTYELTDNGSGSFTLNPSLPYNYNPAPAGVYQFHLAENGSSVSETLRLALPGPATGLLPLRIANWDQAQAVDAGQDFTLAWDKAIKSGPRDVLLFDIHDPNGTVVFTQQMPLNQTNVVIGANTLRPNTVYSAYLSVFHYFALNNRTHPYSYTAERHFTEFHIKTINPAGVLSFSSRAQTVLQSDGTAYIRVDRTQGTQGPVTVDYFTGDGTAYSNLDYTAASGTLMFPDGVSSQLLEVPLSNNQTHSAPVTLHLSLTNATGGATLGGLPHTAVTIRDSADASVPTVAAYELSTREFYWQTGTAAPSQKPGEITSELAAIVFPGYPGSTRFGILQDPQGKTFALGRTFDDYRALFENDQRFPSSTAMASSVRAGRFSFYVEDVLGNVLTTNMTLAAERKIAPPIVSNWTATQAVDPAQDFVLNWGPFIGGTTNDYIHVIVENAYQDYVVYTPNEFEADALRPPKQGYVIPANTLQYGQSYSVLIGFVKVQNRPSPAKGTPAAITSFAGTWVTLKTINSP